MPESNICLSCGLCCDGTLIGFVELEHEEIPALRESLEIEESNDHGLFLQPCTSYCEGCTIYSKRPKQCVSFKCGLLKSIEKQELDFELALETIKEVKKRKIAIQEKLARHEVELQSQSFYFKMNELKKLLKKKQSESSLTQKHLELIDDLQELDTLLSKKFEISLD